MEQQMWSQSNQGAQLSSAPISGAPCRLPVLSNQGPCCGAAAVWPVQHQALLELLQVWKCSGSETQPSHC